MVQYCAVPNCKSSGFTEGIAFHVFPRDPTRFKQWKAKVRRDDRFSPTTQAMRICSKHFVESDYRIVPSGFKFLKKDAVPSIFTFTSPRKLKRPRRRVQYKSDIMDFEFVGLCAPIDLEEDFKVESRDETENEKSSTQIKIEPFSLEFTEADTNTCPDDVKLKSEIEIHDDVIGPVSEPLASSLVEIENKTDIHNDSRQIKQDPLSFEITEADTNACPDDIVHNCLKRNTTLGTNDEDSQKLQPSHPNLQRCWEEQSDSTTLNCSDHLDKCVSNCSSEMCSSVGRAVSECKVGQYGGTPVCEVRSGVLSNGQINSFHKTSREIVRGGLDTRVKNSFTCNLCAVTFKKKESLASHFIKQHTKQVAYVCNFCGKAFKKSSQLDFHIKTHVETPFSCKMCGVKFKFRYHLKNHMKSHATRTPYSCEMCEKSFTSKFLLQIHTKLHTGT